MMNYIQAERLKSKRSFSVTLIWLIPLLNVLFSFLMSPTYFITNTFNWWSTLFMSLSIALWCALSSNKEKKAGNYNSIFLLPVSLHQVWLAKIIVIALHALLSLFIFLIMMGGLSFVFPGMPIFEIEQLEGVLLIWLTSLWQIPLGLYLAKRYGMIVPILVNLIGSMGLGTFFSTKVLWWLNPWDWPIRVIMPIIGVHPSGLLLSPSSPLRNSSAIIISVALATAFVMIVIAVTSLAFSKSISSYASVREV